MAHHYVDSNASGGADGTSWADAYTTIGAALAGAVAAGDNVWVAQDHAEATAGAVSWTDIKGTSASPVIIACVDKAGSVPPVAADLRTTATVATTGANNLTLNATTARCAYIYGITFTAGSGAVSATLTGSQNAQTYLTFINCALQLGGSSGGILALNANQGNVRLINTTLQVAAAGSGVFWHGNVDIIGGSVTGSTFASTMFSASAGGTFDVTGMDLSNLGSGKTLVAAASVPCKAIFRDCKLNANVTFATRPTHASGLRAELIRSDSGATNYRTEKFTFEGDQQTTTTVRRTGGATDGSTAIGWKVNTTANAKYILPYSSIPMNVFNATIGSNISVTVEGVADPRHFSALPTDAEVWFELEYLGTSGNPLGVLKSVAAATFLTGGSALDASSQAWDGGATARANSTAYNLGDVIKSANNAGRIFVCTTAGTTDSSEPVGYASAVDGGTVSDGTAVFTAAWRFKKTITTTAEPQFSGVVRVVAVIAKASSTIYLDPKPVMS